MYDSLRPIPPKKCHFPEQRCPIKVGGNRCKNYVNIFPGVRACLHGGGGPQVGDVTRLGGVTRLSI